MPQNVEAEIRSSVPATMPARGTIARGPMAGRRRGKDARSIEFHYWLRRETRFCVQPPGRCGSTYCGVGGAPYRRARAPTQDGAEGGKRGVVGKLVALLVYPGGRRLSKQKKKK